MAWSLLLLTLLNQGTVEVPWKGPRRHLGWSIVSSSSGSAQFQHWTHQSAFFLFSPSWAQSALTQPPSVSRALREMVTSRVLETVVIFELMTVYQQHLGAAPNYRLLRSTLDPQRSCSLLWFPVWQHGLPDHLWSPGCGWGWLLLWLIFCCWHFLHWTKFLGKWDKNLL